MNYAEFASDLPRRRSFEFASAEENEETMRRHGVYQPVRQLGRGAFRSTLAVLDTDQASLFADRFSTAFSLHLEPPVGVVGLLFPRSANGPFWASGHPVANDQLLVFPSGSGTDMVAHQGLAGSEAMAIPETRFIEMAQRVCPTFVQPKTMAVIEGTAARPTKQLHALRNALLKLVVSPEPSADAEQLSNLIAATIVWLGHSAAHRRPEGLTVRARTRVAKLAREFIEEHYCGTVRIEDLCRATGVGARTLQRSFREYFDLSITEYLKTVRLDAARRALAAAHPSCASVAGIAVWHGLPHLGRFSVEFRERFGEAPRETLATRPNIGRSAIGAS